MNCYRNNCACTAIIAGIIAGVILGVLYAFGVVSTGIVFWAYLLIGVLGLLLAPIYSDISSRGNRGCFCGYRYLYFLATVGVVITAAVGLAVATVAPLAVVAIVLGLATLSVVAELITVICITNCLCGD